MGKMESLIVTEEMKQKALAGDDIINELIYNSVKRFIHNQTHRCIRIWFHEDYTLYDELESIAQVTYWRALQLFDTSKGIKFITYLGQSLWGSWNHYLRDVHNKDRDHGMVSIEEVSHYSDKGEHITFEKYLKTNGSLDEDIIFSELYQELLSLPPHPKFGNLLLHVLQGKKQEDIAQEVGTYQESVSKIIKEQKKLFWNLLKEKGMVEGEQPKKQRASKVITKRKGCFTAEQKQKALTLLATTSLPCTKIAKEVGINEGTVRVWGRQVRTKVASA